MIYKKRNKEDTGLYRGIPLVNCIVQIFTRILLDGLVEWMKDSQYLPEFQAGVRPARDCIHHSLVLSFIIQIHLFTPGGKIFACFVDFKKAFSSVNHDSMWSKLLSLGVSTTFIKIVKSLYYTVRVSIRTPDCLTSPVDANCVY